MASSISSSLLDEPLSRPPPGQHSDFTHPPSRAPEVYITAGVCLPLILVFAGLRFYAKVVMKRKKTWDDCKSHILYSSDLTCALGLVRVATLDLIVRRTDTKIQLAAISFTSCSFATISGGAYGFHQWDITIRDFSKVQLVLTLTFQSIYGPCIWFIKLSLFFLYLEIFGVLRWLRIMSFVGMITTGLFYFATMVPYIILCSPKNGYSQFAYLTALASPQCAKRSELLSITVGSVNVISDLYLVILPLPAVWSLQLPLRRKIGVSAMLLTGSIGWIASIFGLHYRVVLAHTTDNTWAAVPMWICIIVEMTAGILVCCMPTTAIALRQLKGPASSFFATSCNYFRSFTRSTFSRPHDKLGSTYNLRPRDGDSTRQDNSQEQYEIQKPWSGPGNARAECQAERETMAMSPLEDSAILKSTKVEVTRGSGAY